MRDVDSIEQARHVYLCFNRCAQSKRTDIQNARVDRQALAIARVGADDD